MVGYSDGVLIFHDGVTFIVPVSYLEFPLGKVDHPVFRLELKFVIIRGGSNSIVLQYYCKVLQYFGIATSQSIAKSQSIAILIAKFSSIVKSIAKIFKYCK